MSCGQIALIELGISVEAYYASEIDKHAIKQTQLNFPETIQLGSVTDVKAKDLPKIDLLLGGSPCQGFSFAGKQLNFEDPRSFLLFEYVRILNELRELNPDIKFLLENVRMKKIYEEVISEHLGVRPVVINSSLVSAQNRVRLYWSNIRMARTDPFGLPVTAIPLPQDKGLLFRDIMEEDVPEKYYLRDKVLQNLITHKERNAQNGHGYGMVAKSIALRIGGHGMYDFVSVPDKTQNPRMMQRPHGFNNGKVFQGKVPTLTSSSWELDNFVIEPGVLRTHKIDGGFRPIKSGKAGCLCARARQDGSGQGVLRLGERIRRYTPTECARLQTIPEWYRWECSETQQYKMLGNGWTVEVIKHILSYL